MAELFKTLEFTSIEKDTLGKYAHPIEVGKEEYVWAGSSMPMLMTKDSTIRKIKQLYKGLDFDCVKLTPKKLIDFNP